MITLVRGDLIAMTTRKPVSTKRKAARATKAADVLRKVALSAFVASTFTAYALHERQSTPDSNLLTLPDGSPVMAAAQAPTPLPEWIDLTTLAHSQYKDGAYTGTRVDSYYGSVQVQAVIQFGSITDVQFLVYPAPPASLTLRRCPGCKAKRSVSRARTSISFPVQP